MFCAVVLAGVWCCVCALPGLRVAHAPCPGVLLRRCGDSPSLWGARLAPWRALLAPGCGPARGSGVCVRWGGGVRFLSPRLPRLVPHSPHGDDRGGVQVCWGSGPRAAPHPPPPRGGTSAPTARARWKGTRRRHGGGQDGVPQAAARKESREAAARHPPPPPPHRPASPGGPGPHPPRRGDGPLPARERSRSATRPPAPAACSHGGCEEQASPRLRTGTPHRSYPEKPGEHEPEWYGGPRPPWTAQRQ